MTWRCFSPPPEHAVRIAWILLLALAGCAGGLVSTEAPAPGGSGSGGGLSIESLASGVSASLRGLDVVDDRVAWASGSEGHAGVSTDGGRSWSFERALGYEERDFRDVEGFSAERALLLAVGAPGLILETEDGGATWKERYRDDRAEVFLDAIECAELERSDRPAPVIGSGSEAPAVCLAFGDPIDGRFLLLRSEDSGRTWTEIVGPEAIAGEAAFAASGTALRFAGDAAVGSETAAAVGAHAHSDQSRVGTPAPDLEVALGTGGAEPPRVLRSSDLGRSWRAEAVPLAAGAPSRGVFSLVANAGAGWVAVGGDHAAENARTGTAAHRAADRSGVDGKPSQGGQGSVWRPATRPPGGYRSAVERLADGRLVATGPTGTDLSDDGGATWRRITTQGFHAVRRARRGELVLLAGADGRIARLAMAQR